ncbi:hypothetical protein ACHABQ_13685 [Nesterenkonia aurantiaca]|uniref:hypothetical protein n=1 Tax=Nesterenkonia aurantiaca TaxID=1436010 RepID=UPI003EE76B2F
MGERWVFIDWDAAAPSTRLWDLAYAAQAFTLSDTTRRPQDTGEQLAAVVDGYGADDDFRAELPGGHAPQGLGEHWRSVAEYVERHAATWSRVLGHLD